MPRRKPATFGPAPPTTSGWLQTFPWSTEESTEYNAALNEVSTYSAAQIAKFITGEADLDTEWDEYVSTCESLGVQTMIDIYTDAVARYNAA